MRRKNNLQCVKGLKDHDIRKYTSVLGRMLTSCKKSLGGEAYQGWKIKIQTLVTVSDFMDISIKIC